jgi:DNA adenine methylase
MIPWIGGKYRQSKWIYETSIKNLAENGNIKTYVEPFSGAFWNYLRTDIYKYVNNIVYNDKNKFLVNLFYTVKNKRSELLEVTKNMKPANNVEFERNKEVVFKVANGDFEIGNIEVAKSYAYAQLHAYNGNTITPGMKHSKDKKKFGSFIRKLDGTAQNVKNFFEKMNSITSINNKDYKEVIKENDNEDTLFYVDPPYFNKERFYGFNDFNKKEHIELAKILKNIKGKFVLSYYYFNGIEELYPKDKFYYFKKEFTKTSSKNADKGEEIIICNFNPADYEIEVANNVEYKSKSKSKKSKRIITKEKEVANSKTKKTRKKRVSKTDKVIKLLENLVDKFNKIENRLDDIEKEIIDIKKDIKELKENRKEIKVANNIDYKKDEIKVVNETKDINNNNIEIKPANNVNYKVNRNIETIKISTFNENKSLIKDIINNNIEIRPVNNVNYEPELIVKVVNKRDNKIYKIYKNYLLNNINNITIKLNKVLNNNLYTPNAPNLIIS